MVPDLRQQAPATKLVVPVGRAHIGHPDWRSAPREHATLSAPLLSGEGVTLHVRNAAVRGEPFEEVSACQIYSPGDTAEPTRDGRTGKGGVRSCFLRYCAATRMAGERSGFVRDSSWIPVDSYLGVFVQLLGP